MRWRRRRRHLSKSSTTGAPFTRFTNTQVQILTQQAMQTVYDGQGSEENASETHKSRPDNSRGTPVFVKLNPNLSHSALGCAVARFT